MMYEGNVVRRQGNNVAHEATKGLVRNAVVYGDFEALENIYQCVYDELLVLISVDRMVIYS